MFSLNKKLDPNLKVLMDKNSRSYFRVLIKHKNFQDSIAKKLSKKPDQLIRIIPHCNIICANINAFFIKRLVEYPEIEYIALDQYLSLCGLSVSTANKINLSNKTKLSGNGIGIGIIDTGAYPHRDLTLPSNKISTFIDLVNNYSYPYDDNGHGTCTCGIIAGSGSSSNGAYKGIAYNCSLHVYKAFDKLGKGLVSDTLFAINDLITISEKYNIKVLCLPFEMLNFNSFIFNLFDQLFQKALSQNIIPIVPSGSMKNLDNSITGIALSTNCLTISGLDTTSTAKSYKYSSCGLNKKYKKPDFSAACVDIVSLNTNPSYISEKNNLKVYAPKLDISYKTFTGTSIASAYITALCALLFEYNPSFSADDVISLLSLAIEPLDLPFSKQGAGPINILKVIN